MTQRGLTVAIFGDFQKTHPGTPNPTSNGISRGLFGFPGICTTKSNRAFENTLKKGILGEKLSFYLQKVRSFFPSKVKTTLKKNLAVFETADPRG